MDEDFTSELENSLFVEELLEREKDDLLAEYELHKKSMEWYFGKGRCLEALAQYMAEFPIKTER